MTNPPDASETQPAGGATLHRIALRPNAVSQALAVVRDFCAAERPGCDAALAVIVEELVCNLVDHADAGAEDFIELALERTDGATRLILADGGPPFDPRGAPPPGDLPPERGGGAGLAIVLAWSRIVAYERVDGRNRLELLLPDGN